MSSGVAPVDRQVLPQVMASHAANVNVWDLLSFVRFRNDHEPGKTLTMEDFSPSTLRRFLEIRCRFTRS